MADFVAVLKKTIDGLGETTPETREKVYGKARATIAAKLAAIVPPPPASIAERQKKALEDAIATVETEYAKPAPEPVQEEDDLEALFASMDDEPKGRSVAADGVSPVYGPPAFEPISARPQAEPTFPASRDEDDDPLIVDQTPAPRRGRSGIAVAALILLLAVAGGGYAVWLNRTDFQAMLGPDPSGEETAQDAPADAEAVATADQEGTDAGEDEAPVEEPAEEAADPAPAAGEEPETDVAAVDPAEQPAPPADPAPAPDPVEGETPEKFTQRLTPEGTEVDVGPAGGEATVGEGTSVATAVIPATPPVPAAENDPAAADTEPAPAGEAAATTPSPPSSSPTTPSPATSSSAPPAPDFPPAAPATPPPAGTTAQAGAPAQAAIAVGQRAIFYEERTSAAQGSAETGSIVWSLVQESPGGDQPPEPAVRAEATIPGKDLQLRMTIRRNRDQTLPASHIVELIFLTPDEFEGGGIENVLRMTMKSSEESAGNPLLGIPAKIADGFFLLALTDGEAEIAQNTALLARDQWIDVPMVYRSGRRALITLEKGVPGSRVFDEAIKAWQSASSG